MPFAVRNAPRSPQLPAASSRCRRRSRAGARPRPAARACARGSAGRRRSGHARHRHGVGRVGHAPTSTSSGSASTTGPGRPATAVANARATSSGMRSGRSISKTHLAMRAEHLLVVDLLERLAPAVLARHLADQQHERRGVLHRRVHAGRGVRRARAARDHADARAAGQLAVGVGGVRGRRLVAAGDDAQPRRDARRGRRAAPGSSRRARRTRARRRAARAGRRAAARRSCSGAHSSTGSSRKTV